MIFLINLRKCHQSQGISNPLNQFYGLETHQKYIDNLSGCEHAIQCFPSAADVSGL